MSKPLRPGISMSRKSRSGCSLSICMIASGPLSDSPITRIRASFPSSRDRRERADGSSSTISVFIQGVSLDARNTDGHTTASARSRFNSDVGSFVIKGAEPVGHISQTNPEPRADASPVRPRAASRRVPQNPCWPDAVVFDSQPKMVAVMAGCDHETDRSRFGGQSVFQRVLYDRLQNQ